MTNVEKLVIALGIIFVVAVLVVFRKRWHGALGWLLIAGAFIASVLTRNTATILSTGIAAMVIILGIGLVGYNYYRFERPKRLANKTLLDAPPDVKVKRPSVLKRRRFNRGERH